ncbi:MAG: hypothetical protein RLY30_1454 [Pseudomonadota bacterium]|jgi:3-oxo-5alpha-steroid 4-dehydrogenase
MTPRQLEEVDVVVVGWGVAGAAAAIEALDAGLSVAILDRFSGGGASQKSGGVVYAGGGTRHQRAAGFSDSPEGMLDYLRHEVGDVVSEDTLRQFCLESVANLEWLEALGAPYSHEVPPGGKTSYPSDGYYLYFSGNELVPACQGVRPPAPRGHRTVGRGHGGVVLYAALREACLKKGARIYTQTRVTGFIQDDSGAVKGARAQHIPAGSAPAAEHESLAARCEAVNNTRPRLASRLRRRAEAIEQAHAESVEIRARLGLVLCTGGFIFNRDMVKQYAPKYAANFRIGSSGCFGDGHQLAARAGAALGHMDSVTAWRFINPPAALVGGLAVNAQGERICNEETYGARLGYAICEENGGRAWLILDSRIRRAALRQILFGGLWWFQWAPAFALLFLQAKAARSIAELARKIGIPESRLAQTIAENNESARGVRPDPVGKSEHSRAVIEGPRWFAVDIGVKNPLFPLGALTLGGVRVDEASGAALREDGSVVPGLFAAGRAAVGVASHRYVSGLSLADCVFSGRRAGRALASMNERT